MDRREVLASLGAPFASWFWPASRNSVPERSLRTSTGSDEWPQYGQDAANRGHVQGCREAPPEPELAWTDDAGTQTMNSSPIVSDGVVYAVGTGDPARLVALDPEGEEHWSVDLDGFAENSPVAGDGTVYVGTWSGVRAFDAETGEETWHLPLDHRIGAASPTLVDDRLYVATTGAGPLFVSGPSDVDEFAPPALIAIDAAAGEELWRYDDFGDRDSIRTTPAVANGRVVFTTEGTVHALDASSGDHLWQRDTGSHAELAPTLVDDTVIVGRRGDDGTAVVALEAASGDERWDRPIEANSVRVSPAVADGVVYAPATYQRGCPLVPETDCEPESWGRLYAVDLASGEDLWTVDLQPDTRSAPAVAGETIYVGNGDGISAVSRDGETLWHLSFSFQDDDSGYVKSSPAVAAGHVFLGASDGRLRAVALDDNGPSGRDGWWQSAREHSRGEHSCGSPGRASGRSGRRGGWWSQ